MKCQTNIGLFIVILLMWLFVCATAFCMPMLCPFHHTFCDSQGDMVQCFDKRSIDIYSMAYSPSGVVDTKYCPETGTDITFGYTQGYNNSAFHTPQPQMAYSSTEEDIMMFRWNMNGQLTHIGRPYTEQFRRHVWNEAGQMAAAFGNEYCGYYAYDAQGNRAYKITGYVIEDQHNAGYPSYTAYFDDVTLYVNPYMVVTPRGYTKHYYNGSQRIASRLGDYWNQDNTLIVADAAISRADTLCRNTVSVTESPFQDMEGDEQYIRTDGTYLPIISYDPYISSIRGVFAEDLLWDVLHSNCHEEEDITDEGIFYCHSDHLGSSSWITSDRGQVVQYLHYMPFGELWENQQASEYNERFKFTGKERDVETGYDYFGARFYLSLLGIWLSPDPLLDKYPSISSYAYCGWNPLKYVDLDGRYFDEANEQTAQKIEEKCNALLVNATGKNRKEQLSKTLNDIQDMRNDLEHEFRFGQASVDENGMLAPETSYGGKNEKGHSIINMFSNIDDINETTAHETRHGGQIARKELLADANGSWQNYGAQKEIDAYRAQWGWNGELQLYVLFEGQQFGYQKSITYYGINRQLIGTIVSHPLNPKLLYPPLNLDKRIWRRN